MTGRGEEAKDLSGEQSRGGDVRVVPLAREDDDLRVGEGPGNGRDGLLVVGRGVAPDEQEGRCVEGAKPIGVEVKETERAQAGRDGVDACHAE